MTCKAEESLLGRIKETEPHPGPNPDQILQKLRDSYLV